MRASKNVAALLGLAARARRPRGLGSRSSPATLLLAGGRRSARLPPSASSVTLAIGRPEPVAGVLALLGAGYAVILVVDDPPLDHAVGDQSGNNCSRSASSHTAQSRLAQP